MNSHPKPLATRIPDDAALGGLRTLLDAGLFRRVAAQLIRKGKQPDSWSERPEYVRYKPGTNAVVSWRATGPSGTSILLHGKCYTAGDYPLALEKARENAAGDPERVFVADDEARVLAFAFPTDQVLDGLRFATNRKKIQRAIYAHDETLDEQEWRVSDSRLAITIVRYKPEKRALLRIDTRARRRTTGEKRPVRRWLRVSSAAQGGAAADLTARLHQEFANHPWLSTPRAVAWLPRYGATLLDDVAGLPLPTDTAGCAMAGKALAALHRAPAVGLVRRDRSRVLADAGKALTSATEVAPEIGGEIAEIGSRLKDLAAHLGPDSEPAFVHGDFHDQQLLLSENGVAVLDFDRAHAGDPAADLGNFAAHLLAQALYGGHDLGYARNQGEALRHGYEIDAARSFSPERLTFWRAIGLAHLVPQAFRTLRPDWPDLTAALVTACRKELS